MFLHNATVNTNFWWCRCRFSLPSTSFHKKDGENLVMANSSTGCDDKIVWIMCSEVQWSYYSLLFHLDISICCVSLQRKTYILQLKLVMVTLMIRKPLCKITVYCYVTTSLQVNQSNQRHKYYKHSSQQMLKNKNVKCRKTWFIEN